METISKTSFWLLTIGLFLCNWTNGFCDSIRSVTYSMMKDEVPLSYSQYGGLQSLGLFSYVIWAFAAASVLDSMGYKLTFWALSSSPLPCWAFSTTAPPHSR